ncbi:MAG: carbohydrate-binding family 9-like protein, partial [Pirellulaceae bacterium]
WGVLRSRSPDVSDYEARFKVLYSDRGLYVLMDGTDRRLSAKLDKDFENLWTEDVFEFFIWPDERDPLYFEYEISPLGYELPIIIPNMDGRFLGWRPWHYEGDRRIQKATSVRGGDKTSGAAIAGWTAEFFIPYELLKPLRNVPPRAGATWRANFYRMDYDGPQAASWDWARVGSSFHEFTRFGTLQFQP